ncbi:hypothetical protein MKEN_00260600 [Mycena kentingensis (nom. inval.)]|nr:hypothetical protein MKEN_00260600 [Mycena kentingensis (nom. inval.)]
MPRAATTPKGRGTKDTRPLARTAASVKAALAAAAAATASVSAPVAGPSSNGTPAAVPAAYYHPDELPYMTSGWSDMAIIHFLAGSVFSIGPRPEHTTDAFIGVTLRARPDVGEILIPRSYRLPLLWVAKYAWTSLRIVMTSGADILQTEWDNTKYELLHIARLYTTLLNAAREFAASVGAMDKSWRCAPFDRALRRYWHKWLLQQDKFVVDFLKEFGEDEYAENDVLKLPWATWVLKGHKGFFLEKSETANGISANEFLDGLVIDEKEGTEGSFAWHIGGAPGAGVSLAVGTYLPTPVSPTTSLRPPEPAPSASAPPAVTTKRIPLPGELRRQQNKEHEGLKIKTEALSNSDQLRVASSTGKGKERATEDVEMEPLATNTQSRNAYPSPPTEAGSSRGGSRRLPEEANMDVDPPLSAATPLSTRSHFSPPPVTFVIPTATSFRARMGSAAPGRNGLQRASVSVGRGEDGDDMADALPVMKSEPFEVKIPQSSSTEPIMILDSDAEDPDLEGGLEYPDDEPEAYESASGTGFGSGGTRANSFSSHDSFPETPALPPPQSASVAPSRRGTGSPAFMAGSSGASSRHNSARPSHSTSSSSASSPVDGIFTLNNATFQYPPMQPPAFWPSRGELHGDSLQSNAAQHSAEGDPYTTVAAPPKQDNPKAVGADVEAHPMVVELRAELQAAQLRVQTLEAELGEARAANALAHPLRHLLSVAR